MPLARQIAPHLAPGAIVTDVGSVKGEITRLGHAALGERGHFIGSHPMAGSEKTGWEHSTAGLFERRTCFVTPLPSPATRPRSPAVVRFWHELGGEPVTVSPDQHDEIVAHISHLPQVLASSLCAFLAKKTRRGATTPAADCATPRALPAATRSSGAPSSNRIATKCSARCGNSRTSCTTLHAAVSNRDWLEVIARLERGKAYRDQFRPLS